MPHSSPKEDQSNGLAYVLKGTGSGSYQSGVSLAFTHQLAKIVVKLTGDKASSISSLSLTSYTSCTNTRGTVSGSTAGSVAMKKATYASDTWEANVVPNYTIKKLTIDGTTACELTTSVTPKAGSVHKITLEVNEKVTEIDLSTYTGSTLTVSGKTILTGDGTEKDLKITTSANSTLVLDNVVLKPSTAGNVITCNGNTTIQLVGSNTLSAASENISGNYTYGSGIYANSGTLTIGGEGNLNIERRDITSNGASIMGAGIGVAESASLVINSGTITIGAVPEESIESGAGIGSNCDETSGNITITGGTITIGQPSWTATGIGAGADGSCKDITITGENTVITVKKGKLSSYYIGNSRSNLTNMDLGELKGTITIGGGATVNGTKYTETHTGQL